MAPRWLQPTLLAYASRLEGRTPQDCSRTSEGRGRGLQDARLRIASYRSPTSITAGTALRDVWISYESGGNFPAFNQPTFDPNI